jgi:hypothetical protein
MQLRDKQAEYRSLVAILQQRAHELRVKELKLQARDYLVQVRCRVMLSSTTSMMALIGIDG